MGDLCGNDEGTGGWDPGPCILPKGHGPDHTDGTVHWSTCVFCSKIAAGDVDRRWPAVVCFEPLNPVTPGHMLVVPVVHVPDVAADPFWSGQAMHAAAQLAAEVGDCNVITSRGAAATQTVMHLHIHVVPRRAGDGLALPWTSQVSP